MMVMVVVMTMVVMMVVVTMHDNDSGDDGGGGDDGGDDDGGEKRLFRRIRLKLKIQEVKLGYKRIFKSTSLRIVQKFQFSSVCVRFLFLNGAS